MLLGGSMGLAATRLAIAGNSGDIDDLVLELSMARGLDEIMQTVRGRARALVGADGVTFVLRDGDLCHYADEDAISPLWKGQRFPASSCISGWAMMHRQAAIIEDIYADDRIPHAAYRPTFVRSLVMTPVRIEDPVAAIGAYWSRTFRPSQMQIDMLARIANSAAVAMTNVALYNSLVASREEATRAKDAIVFAMASLAETRDNETGNHIHRTQHFMRALAQAAQTLHPLELTDDAVELLFKTAPLHDVGKIGIADKILLKPGKLTLEEAAIMRTHAELGRRAIARAAEVLGPSRFLSLAEEIAHTHHERWDGGGYPRALRGTQIPLAGRLMAIADVYDALVSKRVYKDAIPHLEAVAIIGSEAGRHFDPDLVGVFLTIADQFDAIHRAFFDS
ncbi:MAG: HD domain-containing protein [Hyphomicrobiales bacterium]|nr:MAG: HD domain-containing protein [Hyphomicrobiales bacterium]